MTVILGSGAYTYQLEEGWGRLPDGWSLRDVAAVGIDQQDRVYVYNRGPHPMIVFDREGNFLKSWGEGLFKSAHGVHVAPDDTIYCTDEGDHTVRQCTLDGKVLLEIGIPGNASPFMSGSPFNRCTHTALSPKSEIYVSDGYGNARVHKYAPDGKLLKSWGEPGTDPGQFNISHNVCCDADGWVYVADRENHRIQIFDGEGRYETQWNNLHRPNGLFMVGTHKPTCYIAEGGTLLAASFRTPNIGARVSIMTHEGHLLARVGHRCVGTDPDQFMAPHGLAVDSHGDIYVGEVSYTVWPRYNPGAPIPSTLRSLRKLKRVVAPNHASSSG